MSLLCLCTWLYLQRHQQSLWGSASLQTCKKRSWQMWPGQLLMMMKSELGLFVALGEIKGGKRGNYKYRFLYCVTLSVQMNAYAHVHTLYCLSGLITGTGGVLLWLQLLRAACLPLSLGRGLRWWPFAMLLLPLHLLHVPLLWRRLKFSGIPNHCSLHSLSCLFWQ